MEQYATIGNLNGRTLVSTTLIKDITSKTNVPGSDSINDTLKPTKLAVVIPRQAINNKNIHSLYFKLYPLSRTV